MLLQAIIDIPSAVAAICGPLIWEAASSGRTEITTGEEKDAP
jgi:hypothetical protein